MTEAGDQLAKSERSMVGFYITVGIVAALVGLGAWLWRPIKTAMTVAYWEHRVKSDSGLVAQFSVGRNADISCSVKRYEAATHLGTLGIAARPAFIRLLANPNRDVRICTLLAFQEASVERKEPWIMPLLPALAKEKDVDIAFLAVFTAECISGQGFFEHPSPTKAETPEAVEQFLSWWGREGKANYGGGGK